MNRFYIRGNNMKPNVLKLSLVLGLASSTSLFAATGGTISFTGTVLNETCKVTTGTENQSISLDAVTPYDFSANIGATDVNEKSFSITVENCTVDLDKGLSPEFATTDDVDLTDGFLKNTNSASNVGIQLFTDVNGTNTAINIASGQIRATPSANTPTSFAYKARYYKYSTGAATPGAVNSSVIYSLTYP